jgi:uncharacterized protein (UPF0332 family)
LYIPSRRFKPRKFLRLAERLVSDKNYETPCRVRTSIGRAYYAAFLFAKEKLERIGRPFSNDHRVHQEVIDRLFDSENSTIGSQLDLLYQNRRQADYDMYVDLPKTLGDRCIAVSERVIRNIERL